MRNFLAIYTKELRSYFVSPVAYVIAGVFLFLSGYLFRNILMHGFDESPFNILVLNGNTSAEYFMDNQRVSVGGFDEGRQAIAIAQWLRTKSPIADRIASLHLIGISNGSHGTLYAAAYNDYFKLPNGEHPINSVAAESLHAAIVGEFLRLSKRAMEHGSHSS